MSLPIRDGLGPEREMILQSLAVNSLAQDSPLKSPVLLCGKLRPRM